MNWRELFEERLGNLDNMSPDDLAALESELISTFDEIDSANGSLADLNDISQAITDVRAASEARASVADLRAQVHTVADTTPVDGDDDGDAGDGDDGTGDPGVVDESGDAGDTAPPAVAASTKPQRVPLATVANSRHNLNNNKPVSLRATSRVVAAGDIPGFGVGQEITTSEQLTMALIRKLQALGRGGTPDDVLVASVVKEFPDDRMLGDDPYANHRKMENALKPKSLIAYGGICQPLAVDYTLDVIGSTNRPLKSALPSFGASRGGIQFMTPPVLSAITPPVPWTVAMDSGGTATKACMRVTCAPPTSAQIYGIPVCVSVGNLMGKYNPEQIQAQTTLLDVATARMAELTLLNAIDTGSTALTTVTPPVLGAARTVLPIMDRIIASYEYRHRLVDTMLRVILPDWVHDILRADLAMELAHDTNGRDPLAVTDAEIEAWFGVRGASPIWMLEDIAGSWPSQPAGPVSPWPATFVGYFFAEGTWQYLDGGSIDVGVVRDSTLNSTNDYQIWREDFEGIAKRGPESLKVTFNVKATGGSSGTVAVP